VLATAAPQITGTGSTGATDAASVTVRIYVGTSASGAPIETLTAALSAGAFATAPANIGDGTYTVQASQADQAGNVGTSAPRTFRIDTTAPAVTITAPADGNSSTATTPTFAGTAGDAAGDGGTVTVKVYGGSSVSGSPVQTLTATRSGTSWSVPVSAALAIGTYTAQAEQSDSVGHTGTSAPSTFTIVATPPTNHAPACTDGTKSTPNATPASIALTCTDADGDALTLSIIAAPGHGSLGTISSGSVTYTPTGTYAGPDSFTFKASDGKSDSNVATISITVGSPGPPPLPTPKPKPKKCTVPDVVGKSLDAAKAAIAKGHCTTGSVHHARSKKVKKGYVLSQSHRPGQKLAVNTKINLVVSRGKK
jgi:Big-like domain-containing protein/PASTA domain-containing protein